MHRRGLLFALVVGVAVLGVGVFVAVAAIQSGGKPDEASLSPSATAAPAPTGGGVPLSPGLRILTRAVSPKDARLNGRLYVVTPGGRTTPAGGPACERVAFGGGRGMCLYLARSGVDYRAAILDDRMHVTHTLGLTGLPSRTRISPDGRYGSMTTFVSGDSYTNPGQFSTRTQIVDLASGRILGDLEGFRVTRDGKPVNAVDRNFWGVTFGRGERFYATMATGRHHYLIEGDVAGRSARVLQDDVECPALSPDGTRIAYKHPAGSTGLWRFHVVDLRSGEDRALAERRSVDDQIAWLDDDNLAYGAAGALWTIRADGGGRPRLLLRGVDSPTVLS